jgi:glycolate dehydrogenase iron-sulfur subunit
LMAEQKAKANPPGAFDAHHPPSQEITDKCVHCGFCLPVCPTYVLWGKEMDSPRGRIYLMNMARQGTAEMNAQWVSHFDSCLGCVACMSACPSGVDYGKLIEATRAQIERNYRRSLGERLHRRLLFETLTRPDRLNLLRVPLLAYQKSAVRELFRRIGLFRLLPFVKNIDALLPKLRDAEDVPRTTAPQGEKRARVGLLLGCVQRGFLSHITAATARVLAAEGYEVVAPPEQPCCGALLTHAGEEEHALKLARGTIDAFEDADVEYIVSNAAGCGSNLKEYGYQLRDHPVYAERAKHFSAKCRDVSEVLAEAPPRRERKPLQLRAAFHDSCHLQHAQGVRLQPRTLLAQIPGLQLLELPESAICCGSAGIYNLVQPEAANALGDRKAALIAPMQPDVVVTGNPGCIFQLQASLERASQRIPVLHTIELLDASIRGVSVESLLQK